MSTRNKQRPPINDVRERARAAREAALKSEARRSRTIMLSIIGVVVVLAVVAVYLLVNQAPKPGTLVYPRGTTNFSLAVPGGTAKPGAPKVEIHIDYACPRCQQYEATNAANLKKWVASGDIALSYDLRSFESPDYSPRAANAAACVYDENPANFLPFTELLFERQSAEGMSDSQLLDAAREVGATDGIATCISTHKFEAWVSRGEEAWKPVANGTPAVFFNGTALNGSIVGRGYTDPAPLEGAVAAALASAP